MTDIGRLRELEAKAQVPSWSTVSIPFSHAAFEYSQALHDAAPHMLSEIETYRAALIEILSWSENADAPHRNVADAAEIARNALAAYDQGKVTI